MDTHEFDGDVGKTVVDRAGDSSLWLTIVGGGRFKSKPSFG